MMSKSEQQEGGTRADRFTAVRVTAVSHLIKVGVEGPSCDLVKKGFPNMGGIAFDKNDVEMLAAIGCAQLSRQLEAACASSDDDDLRFQARRRRFRLRGSRRRRYKPGSHRLAILLPATHIRHAAAFELR